MIDRTDKQHPMRIAVYKERYRGMSTEAATTLTYHVHDQHARLGLLRFPSIAYWPAQLTCKAKRCFLNFHWKVPT